MEMEKLVIVSHNMGEYSSPTGSKSITIGAMRRAVRLLVEMPVLKGMDMHDVQVFAWDEVMIRVHGVGVSMPEGPELEGRRRDWEDGEE
jgi:hypothetical protein